jgi:hypothetical protein
MLIRWPAPLLAELGIVLRRRAHVVATLPRLEAGNVSAVEVFCFVNCSR